MDTIQTIPTNKLWINGKAAQKLIDAGDLRTFKTFAKRYDIRVRKLCRRKLYSRVDIVRALN